MAKKKSSTQSTSGEKTVSEDIINPQDQDTSSTTESTESMADQQSDTSTTTSEILNPVATDATTDSGAGAEAVAKTTPEIVAETPANGSEIVQLEDPVGAADKKAEEFKLEEVEEDSAFIKLVRQYMVDMHPAKPHTPITIARIQQGFYTSLVNHINRNEYSDFAAPFAKFLELIATDKTGVFGEHYFHRGRENLNISREDRRAMQRIFAMVVLVADYKTRAEIVRNSNMEYFLEFGLSERGRNNLREFLNIS